MTDPTAAALIIGNELLTGKIQDLNVAVLAKLLFGLGIELRRVIVCPDDIDGIAQDLNALRETHDWVFTSGGVGPTHDDVTLKAVAQAFGRPLVQDAGLEAMLRGYYGGRLTAEHLRMALVPEGAELVSCEQVKWPTVLINNVFVLPGLPEVFRMKMPTLRQHLQGSRPFVSKAVATRSDEGEIATLLEGLTRRFPQVTIGSYPHWGSGPVRVTVTFDSRDPEAVELAAAAFSAELPSGQLIEPLEEA